MVRLPVELRDARAGQQAGQVRQATLVDLSIAGAGVETDDLLVPGERISVVLTTPTTWDPILLDAVVAWSLPPRATAEPGGYTRARQVSRAGIAFEHPEPASVLAVFEVLATLGYE